MNSAPKCPGCGGTFILQKGWKPGDRGICARCGVPVVVVSAHAVRSPTKDELATHLQNGRLH